MKRRLLLALLALLLSGPVLAGKLECYVPQPDQSWSVSVDENKATIAVYETEDLKLTATWLADWGGSYGLGLTVRNKSTGRDVELDCARIYLRDGEGLVADPLKPAEAKSAMRMDRGWRVAELASPLAFQPAETIPPDSAKKGIICWDRWWVAERHRKDLWLMVGGLSRDGSAVVVPRLRLAFGVVKR